MERLYDFEEECVEGYFREQDIELCQSTEERIKATNNRVENMAQKIEDINQKENVQSATVQVGLKILFVRSCCRNVITILQSIDFRLRKMEESTEQILSTLAVIHRFMSAHTSIPENLQGSMINIPQVETPRHRTLSESEPSNTLQVVRSLRWST